MNYVIFPRISEKAYVQANLLNSYTFVVPADANKHSIKSEIEKEYDVSVLSVNISVLKGKNKRFMMKRGKQSNGKRANTKKAYVVLKDGDTIPVFSEIEDDAPQAPVATKKGKN